MAYTESERESYGVSFFTGFFADRIRSALLILTIFYGSVRLSAKALENIEFVIGIDTLQQSATTASIDESAGLTGGHIQTIGTYGDFTADATVRFEDHSDADSIVTWRLAAAYAFGNGRGQIFASGRYRFRAPSLE